VKTIHREHPPRFALDPWKIREENFSLLHYQLNETIFSLANGYIGMRGSFEEGLSGNSERSNNGIYLNGFFELVPIPHAERGYGYAENTQTLLNVTNSRLIELYLEEERFSLDRGTIISYERSLDMKKGYLSRELTWRSPAGREVKITSTRLISYKNKHLAAFQYRVESLNFSGAIKIRSALCGAIDNHTHDEEDPRFSASLGELGLSVSEIVSRDEEATIIQETVRSNLKMACAMANYLCCVEKPHYHTEQSADAVSVNYLVEVSPNVAVTLNKYVAYYTSRDYHEDELAGLAINAALTAKDSGFQAILAEQQRILSAYWQSVGMELKGDPEAEQGLRYNLFHLFQAAGGDAKTGIPAKGLTSEGYDGHYFWDTEIYMIPFYAAVLPHEARKLLEYRYSILDYARRRAGELSHPRGALYPWRTIAGEEGSSYYPAGTAQYHINAAIAYAVCKYIEMTGDYDFMLDMGAEMLFETARLWENLGSYIPRRGNRFCFHEVTGPDEYTALVSNNCYTNLMAAWHLDFAAKTAEKMKEDYSLAYQKLADKIELTEEELLAWQRASDNMFIPYDDALNIHPQDDSFLDKEIWDFAATPPEKYPLLLHYHPLVIYRYQVCKQPDIILAHLLLGDRFTVEQKQRDYNYYEPITTHDSSLSPSIFGVVSSELGYKEDSYRFFSIATRLDLDNLLKDTHFGVHVANMAGSWMCLVYGFGGMRTYEGKLCFKPLLPDQLNHISFRVCFSGARLEVSVDDNRVVYSLLEGDSISFTHHEIEVELSRGESYEFSQVKRKADPKV
jgi:trehalose/maltose hydrolase-like predicted phosphorylase